MQMPKHSDEFKQQFRDRVTEHPDVVVKPMFGSVGAFVNGNMYAGLFAESFGVKPSPADLAALRELPGTSPFGPTERPMNGWISLPPTMSAADAADWFERAREYVAILPPKAPKAAKATKPKK